MALKAIYTPYVLHFKEDAITSRAVMRDKLTYFIKIWDEENPDVFGLGECALFQGLSPEDNPYYEKILRKACETINNIDVKILQGWSSIRFGIETALRDLQNGGKRLIYDTPWSNGNGEIKINGLIWMGTEEKMLERINEKFSLGYRCIKLKIGGINFDRELSLLRYIREKFTVEELELRLDANGAFTPENALERLNRLAEYDIHSIEQPIKPKQWNEMAEICCQSPIPVALDEELIGINQRPMKERLLETINPRYIILKPSLCGGLTGAYEWIKLAEEKSIGWWITSALESNVGLNAIAQFASSFDLSMPQGLGTGNLYTDNIPSPLVNDKEYLKYDTARQWNLSAINF